MKKEKTAVGLREAVPPLHGGFDAIPSIVRQRHFQKSNGPVGRADPARRTRSRQVRRAGVGAPYNQAGTDSPEV